MMVRASSIYTSVTRNSRMEKARTVVRAARSAIGMVKRKIKGRIRPCPGLSNAMSIEGEETVF